MPFGMSSGTKRRRSSAVEESAAKIRATDDPSASQPSQPTSSAHLQGVSAEDRRYHDLYIKPVDFKLLAQQDPEFAPL